MLKALFIGNHYELLDFIKEWKRRGHNVAAIVTDDKKIFSWAIENQIKIFSYSSLKDEIEISPLKELSPYDCLFSIINHQMLPISILNLAKNPINYHAGPLPEFRGVYGTSWAIYTKKSKYRITWHIMNEKADEGTPVLESEEVIIGPEDTAEMLEVKCLELAKKTFPKLIEILVSPNTLNKVLTNNEEKMKSDLKYPTYKIINKFPYNGLINCYEDETSIKCLYRALKTDEKQPNYLGTFKYLLNGRVIYPGDITMNSTLPKVISLKLSDDEIEAGIKNFKITLKNLKDETGYKISEEDIIAIKEANKTNPPCDDKLKQLTNGLMFDAPSKNGKLIKKNIYNPDVEKQWVEVLDQINPANLTFNFRNDFRLRLPSLGSKTQKYESHNEDINESFYLTAILCYFFFLNQTETITVGYTDQDIQEFIGTLKPFFADVLPLTLKQGDFDKGFSKTVDTIKTNIDLLKIKKTYQRDVQLRYPSIRYKNLNFPIIIYSIKNTIKPENAVASLYNLAPIIVLVSNKSFTICYDTAFIHENESVSFENIVSRIPKFIKSVIDAAVSCQFEKNIFDLFEEKIQPVLFNSHTNKINNDLKKYSSVLELINFSSPEENTAIVCEDKTASYQDLNSNAKWFAQKILELGKDNEQPIIVCLPTSIEWLQSILGILRAGKAYIPISFENGHLDEDRIKSILENSQAEIVITQGSDNIDIFKKLGQSLKIIDLKNPSYDNNNTVIDSNVPVEIKRENLAYIIYTSGSTNRPKGVEVEHQNLLFSTYARRQYYDDNEKYHILPLTNHAFDATTGIVFWSLSIGGKLILLSDQARLDPEQQIKSLITNEVTHLIATPVQYLQLLTVLEKQPDYNELKTRISNNLRVVILGGDRWSPGLLNLHQRIFENTALFNEYGPTECTVWTTVAEIYSPTKELDPHRFQMIPLGEPIDESVKLSIINSFNRKLPPGIAGELVIGGPHVARGYRGDVPDDTKKAFIEVTKNGKKSHYYRTSDIVRYSSYNQKNYLEFIGRKDRQFKLNGMFIDKEQIENEIKKIKYVNDVHLMVKNKGQVLQAFILTNEISEDSPAVKIWKKEIELVHQLGSKLSLHLVPEEIMFAENFPLNQNGKIDESQISKLIDEKYSNRSSLNQSIEKNEYISPLEKIWKDICGKEVLINTGISLAELGVTSFQRSQAIERIMQFGLDYKSAHSIAKQNRIMTQAFLIEIFKQKSNPYRQGTAMLTGATGFIGSQLLYDLIRSDYKEIICLLHASSMINKDEEDIKKSIKSIENNFRKFGYGDIDISNNPRVKFIVGNIAKKKLGLKESIYSETAKKIDTIFHCAAKVLHLEPYEIVKDANVTSAEHIIDFARDDKKKVIHFLSTMQTVTMPEEMINKNGYVKSKMEAEKKFMAVSDLSIYIHRIGWAAWNSKGYFLNREKDHFICLLETCLQMQAIPEVKLDIYMLPVEIITREIIKHDHAVLNEKRHIVNLWQKVSWEKISNILKETITESIEYKIISSRKKIILDSKSWQEQLKNDLADRKEYPLKKFIKIYSQSMGLLDTNLYDASPSTESDNQDHITINYNPLRFGKNLFQSGWKLYYQNYLTKIERDILIEFLETGEYEKIQNFLKRYKDPSILTGWLIEIPKKLPETKFSALHLIIRNPKLKEKEKQALIKKLTKKYHISINEISAFKTTLLYEAAVHRLHQVFDTLIYMDENLKATFLKWTDDDFSIFMTTCWFGDYQLAHKCVKAIKKIDSSNKEIRGSDEETLLEKIFFKQNKTGESCIHRAITSESSGILKLMFDKENTDEHTWEKMLNSITKPYDRSVLHHAAKLGNADIINLLLQKISAADLSNLTIQPNNYGHNFISFVQPDQYRLKLNLINQYFDLMMTATSIKEETFEIMEEIEDLLKYERKYIKCELESCNNSEKDNEINALQIHDQVLKKMHFSTDNCSASDISSQDSPKSERSDFSNDIREFMIWLGSTNPDANGIIPFHYCAMFGFDVLLDQFVEFCKTNDPDMLKKVLNYKNIKNNNRTALHLATRENYNLFNPNTKKTNLISFPNLKIAKLLIHSGANVNAVDENNTTPLYEAIFTSIYINTHYSQLRPYDLKFDCGLSKYLIEKNANLFTLTKQNYSSLMLACWRNSKSTAELIIAKVNDAFITGKKPHFIHSSLSESKIPIVISNVADYINIPNYNSETALHAAVENRNHELVKLLLDNGADPNIKDKLYEKTPLHRAVEQIRVKEDLEIVESLVKGGANVYALKSHLRKPEDLLHTCVFSLRDDLKKILYDVRQDAQRKTVHESKLNLKSPHSFHRRSKDIRSSISSDSIELSKTPDLQFFEFNVTSLKP